MHDKESNSQTTNTIIAQTPTLRNSILCFRFCCFFSVHFALTMFWVWNPENPFKAAKIWLRHVAAAQGPITIHGFLTLRQGFGRDSFGCECFSRKSIKATELTSTYIRIRDKIDDIILYRALVVLSQFVATLIRRNFSFYCSKATRNWFFVVF